MHFVILGSVDHITFKTDLSVVSNYDNFKSLDTFFKDSMTTALQLLWKP